jgi:hypothetical protein
MTGPERRWCHGAHLLISVLCGAFLDQLGHCAAVAVDQPELLDCVQNTPKSYAVFRVTPNDRLAKELDGHPEPAPGLRTRGAGYAGMALHPPLKKLRQAIPNTYRPA